jgi:hypothetical protein
MTSLHVMHVTNDTFADIMTVDNANLYVVLDESSNYFRVWQEVADCLIAVSSSEFLRVNIMAGPRKEMRVSVWTAARAWI